jgi:hypothetical protein
MKRFITIPRSQHQGILPHLTFSHSLDHAEQSDAEGRISHYFHDLASSSGRFARHIAAPHNLAMATLQVKLANFVN